MKPSFEQSCPIYGIRRLFAMGACSEKPSFFVHGDLFIRCLTISNTLKTESLSNGKTIFLLLIKHEFTKSYGAFSINWTPLRRIGFGLIPNAFITVTLIIGLPSWFRVIGILETGVPCIALRSILAAVNPCS